MGHQLSLPGVGTLFIYPKRNHQPVSFTVLNFIDQDICMLVEKINHQEVGFIYYHNLPGRQDSKEMLRGLSVNQGPDIAWFKDPSENILSVIQNQK